jgi:hypothetical protein
MGTLPGGMVVECEDDDTPLSNAKVNEWIYTPIFVHGMHRVNFIFSVGLRN